MKSINYLKLCAGSATTESGCPWDVQEELDRLFDPAELTEGGIKHQ
ncbi:MAG: hypothetical protein OSA87_07130 [Woeseiaceae bacterium]|nr:hypothetical protein [Woeseiaceae bacterium]